MDIRFKEKALTDYNWWAVNHKKTFGKIVKLIIEITRTPYEGSGSPEELKYELAGYWSRQINLKDRLVYKIEDTELVVYQCKGHIPDKFLHLILLFSSLVWQDYSPKPRSLPQPDKPTHTVRSRCN